MMSGRIRDYATLFLRIALAAAFLTSVTDRLGMWGSYGTTNVAWGEMTHFTAYTAKLNPWFPNGFIPDVAWFVTAAETILAVTLFFGFQTRIAAQLSGWLLLAFGVGMTAGTGLKSALNASVFSASAGAFSWRLRTPTHSALTPSGGNIVTQLARHVSIVNLRIRALRRSFQIGNSEIGNDIREIRQVPSESVMVPRRVENDA